MSTTNSSDTSNTNNKNKPTALKESGNFIASLIGQLIILGILVIAGTCMLYTCRVAQSNILPTDINCSPYTNELPNILEKSVNIDIVKTAQGIFSTKLIFPMEENMQNLQEGFIGKLNKMKDPALTTNNFSLYYATTIQQVLANNLNIINWIYSAINNSIFNETSIIFIVPFISIFVNFISSIVNGAYLIFLWFYNLHLFFSTNEVTTNNLGKKEHSWVANSMWSLTNWWKSIILIWAFIILFIIAGIGLIIPILTTLITLFSILLPLFMTARKDGGNKSYTFTDALMNVLKYKRNIIMYIISLFVIVDANTAYGTYSAFVAIVACAILSYFVPIYTQYIPKNVSAWTGDFKQAIKSCGNKEIFQEIEMITKQVPIPIIAPNNNKPSVEQSVKQSGEQAIEQANENTPLIAQHGGNKKNNKNISRKSNK